MIGYWIVEKFTGSQDAQGYDTSAWCASKMDMNLKATLFLPPYIRKSQCNIGIGDTVFGISDDTSGLGVALVGEGSADFQYFFDADILVKKKLDVTKDITSSSGNIQATVGDVTATTISLKNHIHQITSIPPQDCAIIVASASSGTPTPLTLTYTITPS